MAHTVNGTPVTPLPAATVTQIAVGIALVLIVVGLLSIIGAAHVAAAPVDALASTARDVRAAARRPAKPAAEKS